MYTAKFNKVTVKVGSKDEVLKFINDFIHRINDLNFDVECSGARSLLYSNPGERDGIYIQCLDENGDEIRL